MMVDKELILFLDIETKPLELFGWGIRDQHIAINQIKEDWELICWAAKWKGSDKIMSAIVPVRKGKNADLRVLKPLWKLMDKAKIIVGHNIDAFDIPKINARLIANDFKPPTRTRTLDTLKMARQRFKFTSNKLEYLAKFLGLDVQKYVDRLFNGMDLWIEFMKGNKKARAEMIKYNKQDVVVLEAVFNKLMPWYKTTINFNVYNTLDSTIRCHCGSTSFKKNGTTEVGVGVYQRYLCLKCRHETRDGVNLLSKEKKKTLRK